MIDPRFVIKLNTKSGPKEFVLLAGLLDLAHNSKLRGIETAVLPEFSLPAENVWVVQAIGRFATDGQDAIYYGHGDADPSNSQMRGAYLRHAETRAIARMLRMAVNVGMAAVEELGPDADEPPPRPLARHEGKADTYRPERAARTPDSPGDAAASGYVAEPYLCSDCGEVVDPRIAQAAIRRFGTAFCTVHGKAKLAESKP